MKIIILILKPHDNRKENTKLNNSTIKNIYDQSQSQ